LTSKLTTTNGGFLRWLSKRSLERSACEDRPIASALDFKAGKAGRIAGITAPSSLKLAGVEGSGSGGGRTPSLLLSLIVLAPEATHLGSPPEVLDVAAIIEPVARMEKQLAKLVGVRSAAIDDVNAIVLGQGKILIPKEPQDEEAIAVSRLHIEHVLSRPVELRVHPVAGVNDHGPVTDQFRRFIAKRVDTEDAHVLKSNPTLFLWEEVLGREWTNFGVVSNS
jgi:hypothetical protein